MHFNKTNMNIYEDLCFCFCFVLFCFDFFECMNNKIIKFLKDENANYKLDVAKVQVYQPDKS